MTIQSIDRAHASAASVTAATATAAIKSHSLISYPQCHDLDRGQTEPTSSKQSSAESSSENAEERSERLSTIDNVAYARHVRQLFERYHRNLVRRIARRTGSWEAARDIASQAFLQLVAHEKPGSIRFLAAYLYRTAHNLTTNFLLREALRREHRALLSHGELALPVTPEQETIASERHAVLERALGQLPLPWRTALILRLAHDETPQSVANELDRLGFPVCSRTVRRYLRRALLQCRSVLYEAARPTPTPAIRSRGAR